MVLLISWLPVAGGGVPTSGFEVDTSDRNEVLAFWHSIYQASEGYWDRMGWTGDYSSTAAGAEGTVSDEFIADVERRVNFFRALCGVPANISFERGSTVLIESGDRFQPAETTPKEAAAQRSAFMMGLSNSSGVLSHDPPGTLPGWTKEAWNGNNKGALAKGLFGPGAIDVYFREDVSGVSNWNFEVGHRRWLLAVPATRMATGDTPGSYNNVTYQVRQPTNVLYVKPKDEELTPVAPRFVSYPAPGYFPAPLNSPLWSLSLAAADFSSATVSMTDESGATVPTSIISRETGYAENAIVWLVPEEVASKSAPVDRTYQVTVSGMGGPGPASHTWTVTLIDPDRLPAKPALTGTTAPPADGSAWYACDPIPGSDRLEVGFFKLDAATWVEGAEDGASTYVIDHTGSSYELRDSVNQLAPGYPSEFRTEGAKAFHLSFPTSYNPRLNGTEDQILELDREIVPGTTTQLRFKIRRGWTTTGTILACERSTDGGVSWAPFGSEISGKNNSYDNGFSTQTFSLPDPGTPTRIRFRLYHDGGSLYAEDSPGTAGYAKGFFLDEIEIINGDWLNPGGLVNLEGGGAPMAAFGDATASMPVQAGDAWWIRARAVLGGQPFDWGDPLTVVPTMTPSTGFQAWLEYEHPQLSGGFEDVAPGGSLPLGVAYGLGLDPMQSVIAGNRAGFSDSKLTLERSLDAPREGVRYAAECSSNLNDWSEEGVSVTFVDGVLRAETAPGHECGFLRWKIEEQ